MIQGGCGAGLLYSVLTCDLPDIIHSNTATHSNLVRQNGDMTTFVDDSTNYFGHENPQVVKNVTQNNYDAINEYMNSNKLKINGDKSHLIVMTRGDRVGGGELAAEKRAAITLQAGGKVIRGSEQERLLGGIIHQSGSWKRFIREGKGSVVKQLISRTAALKIVAKNADFKTRLMVAGGLIQAKLSYLLPLFGAAPEYLMKGLQVQQLAAARVVVGHACFKWSSEKILQTVGWLSVKQLHQYSVILLTHRIITTGRPTGLHAMIVSYFPYNTRRVEERQEDMAHTPRQIRQGDQFGHVSATSLCGRSFRHQALAYNHLPGYLRGLTANQLKPKLKQWIKCNIAIR